MLKFRKEIHELTESLLRIGSSGARQTRLHLDISIRMSVGLRPLG